jgi:hypothetical protein
MPAKLSSVDGKAAAAHDYMASSWNMRVAHTECNHSFVEGFFTGYGQKRGENLATQHDIAMVLDQLRRQRHEDMKREAALDIMRVYGTLLQASFALFQVAASRAILQHQPDLNNVMRQKSSDDWESAYKQFQDGMKTFWQLEQMARLIFPTNICNQMKIVKDAFQELVTKTYENTGAFDPLHKALEAKQQELSNAIKAELQIRTAPVSNS